MNDLAAHIAAVPDFPKPGIVFRDIAPRDVLQLLIPIDLAIAPDFGWRNLRVRSVVQY